MDLATAIIAVGALVLVIGAGRVLIDMLGGGDAARRPRAGFHSVVRIGRKAGASAAGGWKTLAGLGRIGRLDDDEVRRVLDALKSKTPPRRR